MSSPFGGGILSAKSVALDISRYLFRKNSSDYARAGITTSTLTSVVTSAIRPHMNLAS